MSANYILSVQFSLLENEKQCVLWCLKHFLICSERHSMVCCAEIFLIYPACIAFASSKSMANVNTAHIEKSKSNEIECFGFSLHGSYRFMEMEFRVYITGMFVFSVVTRKYCIHTLQIFFIFEFSIHFFSQTTCLNFAILANTLNCSFQSTQQ